MKHLHTFDPGNNTGIAIFTDGRLVYADAMRFEALIRMPRMVADEGNTETIIEVPQVYRIEHHKGDPQDLVWLALKAGRLAERHGAVKTRFVLPREWKGQAPKHVTKNRSEDVLGPFERDCVRGSAHDMWDAIAIGLKELGRI